MPGFSSGNIWPDAAVVRCDKNRDLSTSPDHGPSWRPIFGGSDVLNSFPLSLWSLWFLSRLFDTIWIFQIMLWWTDVDGVSVVKNPLDPLDPTVTSSVQNWRPKHWATWVVFRTFNLTPWHRRPTNLVAVKDVVFGKPRPGQNHAVPFFVPNFTPFWVDVTVYKNLKN